MDTLTYQEFLELEKKYTDGQASAADLERLEPYRAKRAVLLASGFGSRLLPITINTPKPLVNVCGKRIIETILDALVAIDVEQIIIVTGYLSKQFESLLVDYPQVKLVYNEDYSTTNNISSAVAAARFDEHAFENAYVFESDLYLKNPELLKKYNYCSYYTGVSVSETPDWCFDTCDGIITSLHKGGEDCHHMFGISYWTQADGKQLACDLETVFADPDCRQIFWDDVPCVIQSQNYSVAIKECTFDDIDEIDSFAELQQVDSRYLI